jgi:hypothetical protein
MFADRPSIQNNLRPAQQGFILGDLVESVGGMKPQAAAPLRMPRLALPAAGRVAGCRT